MGNNYQLYATLEPLYASEKGVKWEVTSGNAVTVDENGLLSAVEEGNATVKVTTTDGGFTDSCEVNVIKEIKPVYGVRMSGCPVNLLHTGDSLQLVAIVLPEDADDASVMWTSSNPSLAIVDENGLVKALSQGSVKIMVKTNDGGFAADCIMGIQLRDILVTGLEIDGCPAETLPAHSTFQLDAVVNPSNASNQTVFWNSSDETVAAIDENGLITTLNAGSTTISATTDEGRFTDNCVIMVDLNTGSLKFKNKPENVLVYPNPVTNKLHLRFSDTDKNREIIIYDIRGQLIFKDSAVDLHKLIAISDLKVSGLLAIQIKSDQYLSLHKICVL